MNGDGRADVLVGAPAPTTTAVRLGLGLRRLRQAAPGTVDLAALGQAGFRIDGAAAIDHAGYSVAGAGDVNGDGRADVLVGAHYGRQQRPRVSGSAYVVFGKAAPANVDLAALGQAGFRIDGAAAGDDAGCRSRARAT